MATTTTNPKIIGNQSLTQFDVLIVGSGAGASATANVLTAAGKKVLMLEAGVNGYRNLDNSDWSKVSTNFSNDELKLLFRNYIMPHQEIEPRTYRQNESAGDRTYTGEVNSMPKTVGGAAVHADVKTPRFAPNDFKLGTLLGPIADANFADWPWTYDDLEPFYSYVEKAIGVQGLDGSDPFAGPRSSTYPMPPGVPMYAGQLISDGAKKLGYHPFPYPTAVTSRPYKGRPACNDCGFCGQYGCPIHAKCTPAVTLLRDALLTGNLQLQSETRAVKILTNASGTSVTGIQVIGPDGKLQTFTADRYVLGMSPIEDARLCFLSSTAGIGNSSGMVGRNLTFHFQTLAAGIWNQRVHGHRGRTVTHGISDFRGTPGDPNHPMGGVVEFGAPDNVIGEALDYFNQIGLIGDRLKASMRQSPLRDHLMVITMHAEDAPQVTNRVDLDPAVRDLDGLPVPRITYSNHKFELDARAFYGPKMVEILQMAGTQWAFVAPADPISISRHVFGTLRAGTDSTTSVCDATGKFHDLDNLYGTGSSLFPTSSGYNPYLTITTVGTHVGATMVSPDSPLSALPAA